MPSIGEPPQITDTEVKLIEKMMINRGDINGGYFPIAKALLEVKGQKEEAKQARSLMISTAVLAGATIVLVIVTGALVYATLHPNEQKPTIIVKLIPQAKK